MIMTTIAYQTNSIPNQLYESDYSTQYLFTEITLAAYFWSMNLQAANQPRQQVCRWVLVLPTFELVKQLSREDTKITLHQ